MTAQITAEQYEDATGHTPIDDDLDRCNCPHAGEPGHWYCGWSMRYSKPNFMLPLWKVEAERKETAS